MITIKADKAVLLAMLKVASVFDGYQTAVRLKAGAGRLSVEAVDLLAGGGIHLEAPLPAHKDIVELSICVPTRTLIDTINTGGTDEIGLQFEDEKLVVKTNAKTSIKAAAEVVSGLENFTNDYKDTGLTCAEFAAALDKAVFAAKKEAGERPALCAVNIECDNHLMTLTGADGFRLSKVVLPTAMTGQQNFLLARGAALGLSRVLKDNQLPLQIGFGSHLFLKWEGGYAFGFGVQGQFPNWRQIMPKEFNTKMLLQAQDFIRAVKIARLFSEGKEEPVVRMDVTFDQVNIKSIESEVGSSNVAVTPISLQGNPLEIAFNANYIPLQMVEGEGVEISMNKGNMPVIIKNNSQDDWLYLLMPVLIHG